METPPPVLRWAIAARRAPPAPRRPRRASRTAAVESRMIARRWWQEHASDGGDARTARRRNARRPSRRRRRGPGRPVPASIRIGRRSTCAASRSSGTTVCTTCADTRLRGRCRRRFRRVSGGRRRPAARRYFVRAYVRRPRRDRRARPGRSDTSLADAVRSENTARPGAQPRDVGADGTVHSRCEHEAGARRT